MPRPEMVCRGGERSALLPAQAEGLFGSLANNLNRSGADI